MSRVQSSPALDVISEDECYELLTGVQVGRVIVSIDALPAAFPVNYWLGDKAIVFRTAPGTKLTAAVSHTVVGFEVDEIDPGASRRCSMSCAPQQASSVCTTVLPAVSMTRSRRRRGDRCSEVCGRRDRRVEGRPVPRMSS
jgi:nitroimidazol reductase NimA-like FMN-containing flavoprotein (pyridoxamine 5'-phosphate oxidase superfamily)